MAFTALYVNPALVELVQGKWKNYRSPNTLSIYSKVHLMDNKELFNVIFGPMTPILPEREAWFTIDEELNKLRHHLTTLDVRAPFIAEKVFGTFSRYVEPILRARKDRKKFCAFLREGPLSFLDLCVLLPNSDYVVPIMANLFIWAERGQPACRMPIYSQREKRMMTEGLSRLISPFATPAIIRLAYEQITMFLIDVCLDAIRYAFVNPVSIERTGQGPSSSKAVVQKRIQRKPKKKPMGPIQLIDLTLDDEDETTVVAPVSSGTESTVVPGILSGTATSPEDVPDKPSVFGAGGDSYFYEETTVVEPELTKQVDAEISTLLSELVDTVVELEMEDVPQKPSVFDFNDQLAEAMEQEEFHGAHLLGGADYAGTVMEIENIGGYPVTDEVGANSVPPVVEPAVRMDCDAEEEVEAGTEKEVTGDANLPGATQPSLPITEESSTQNGKEETANVEVNSQMTSISQLPASSETPSVTTEKMSFQERYVVQLEKEYNKKCEQCEETKATMENQKMDIEEKEVRKALQVKVIESLEKNIEEREKTIEAAQQTSEQPNVSSSKKSHPRIVWTNEENNPSCGSSSRSASRASSSVAKRDEIQLWRPRRVAKKNNRKSKSPALIVVTPPPTPTPAEKADVKPVISGSGNSGKLPTAQPETAQGGRKRRRKPAKIEMIDLTLDSDSEEIPVKREPVYDPSKVKKEGEPRKQPTVVPPCSVAVSAASQLQSGPTPPPIGTTPSLLSKVKNETGGDDLTDVGHAPSSVVSHANPLPFSHGPPPPFVLTPPPEIDPSNFTLQRAYWISKKEHLRSEWIQNMIVVEEQAEKLKALEEKLAANDAIIKNLRNRLAELQATSSS